MRLDIIFENYLNYSKVKTSKGNYEFNKSHLSLVQNWFYSKKSLITECSMSII